MIFSTSTPDQPDHPDPKDGRRKPGHPHIRARHFQNLGHHTPHGIGKQRVSRPFQDQGEAEGCNQICHSPAAIA